MQEIEVKARIRHKDELLNKLEGLGCKFSEPITQRDRIFISKSLSRVPVNNGDNVLRIREQDGRYIFTLKQQVSNQMDCIEKETEIANPQAMYDAFELLGFHEIAQVNKTRKKSSFNHETLGKMEICIDDVENLGSYIEAEVFAPQGYLPLHGGTDGTKVQKELFEFLKTLGVKKGDQVTDGYDVLLKNKLE